LLNEELLVTLPLHAQKFVRILVATFLVVMWLAAASATAQQPAFPLMVSMWGYTQGVTSGTPIGIGNWPNGEGSLTVSGTQGSNTVTINSVNVGAISDYGIDTPHAATAWAIVIPGDDGVYRCYNVYVVDMVNLTLSIYPALQATSTSQVASNLYDSYAGPHLTTMGYYGLVDYMVAQNKGASYLQKYAAQYVSDGLGNYSGTAWTAIGGLNQGTGGYVPPTDCMTQGVFTFASGIDNVICNAYSGPDRTAYLAGYYQTLIGSAVQGQGAKLTANLNGRSGYLDTWVGIEGQYQSEQASARVEVYINGALVLNQNFGGATHIQVPFTHAQAGEIDVTVDSPYPCAPRISNTNWYVWDDTSWVGASPSDPLIPDGSSILVLMDSWGVAHNAAVATRLAQDLPNATITNVSQNSKTAEWAIQNFSTLTAGGPYNYIISDFQINDLISDAVHGISFAQLLTNLETLWSMELGTGATPIYIRSLSTSDTGRIQRLNQWDQTLTADYPVQIESQGEQFITFPDPGTQTYGVTPITLTATASSGLPVSYSVISGSASVAGNILAITGAGAVTVQASQSGNGQWLAATPVSDTFDVNPATLTVTADNKTATEGDGLPNFTASYSGFVNGDNQSELSGVPAFITDAPPGPPVGTWNIFVTQGTLGAQNYIFTFVNGTLTVNPAVAQLTAPPKNTMLSGSSVSFTWSHETNAVSYMLNLGSIAGGSDIASMTTSNLCATINNLPMNGSYVYATLEGSTDGVNYTVEDTGTYVAYTLIGAMISPMPSSTFTGTTVTFTWIAGAGSSAYWVDVGSTPGGNNYEQSGNLGNVTNLTVNNLPSDGSQVYLTLWSLINGQWQYNEYQYTAYNHASTIGVMQTPTPGSTLTGSSQLFTWSAGTQSTAYWIDAGNTQGGNQYFQSGDLGNQVSDTVTGLPTDGSTIYITLWSQVNGQWVYNEYQYTAYSLSSGTGQITSPPPGSTLPGPIVTFNWSAGSGATAYWLDLGNMPGGNQYFQSGNLGNVLQVMVNGLPTDGSTIYATLYSLVNGQWLANSYTYTAFNQASQLGVVRTPTPGSTLSGNTVTFTWNAGSGASAYWLDVGSSPGGNQYYQSGNLGDVLSTTVNTLPADGSQIYVTLYSLVNGQWLYNQYTYTSGP